MVLFLPNRFLNHTLHKTQFTGYLLETSKIVPNQNTEGENSITGYSRWLTMASCISFDRFCGLFDRSDRIVSIMNTSVIVFIIIVSLICSVIQSYKFHVDRHWHFAVDFIWSHSFLTDQGYYAFRNSVYGSWFIRALSEVLLRYGSISDLLSIMTRVNHSVAYEYESLAASAIPLPFHMSHSMP
ncbi:unnamed protein product [Echinostoma caproni]|uniref:CASPASE_P10 domain-containing protein n=1 Tax=Echinostoma caproni TaxID=27848 RepID=A0A183B1W3_9TREM|nr:unnamed protein product [Echinostoma caproni]